MLQDQFELETRSIEKDNFERTRNNPIAPSPSKTEINAAVSRDVRSKVYIQKVDNEINEEVKRRG